MQKNGYKNLSKKKRLYKHLDQFLSSEIFQALETVKLNLVSIFFIKLVVSDCLLKKVQKNHIP